uniref:Cyclic nucleotide-binding domain-containing protein n=1 Tax=Globisporangium ultimum (strain ATCC 200006 / CBS 805.95 / DAOM BR144) TaxID=431595 RepID=K3WAT1_GLOUD
MVWILCLQLILCYNWIVIPLQLAFPLLDDKIVPILILNFAVDVIQWVDIYLSLNLSYSINSEKIFDPVRSAERYLKSWSFVMDICCIWPYAIFKPSLSNTTTIRIPQLLRVWRLKGHFSEVENFMLINSRKRLILFGLVLLMLYHVVACLHFSITHWEGFSHKIDAWIPSDDIYMRQINGSYFEDVNGFMYAVYSAKVQRTRAIQYFRSLYYATNVLAALGRTMEPDSERQYVAALLFMLSGFLITAIVVDNVQKRFTASAFEQKEFFATRSRIQLFLKRQNSPLSIHQRVNSFLDFWWSSHRGAIIHELLEELPAAIKRDIVRSICTPAIESFNLLRIEDPYKIGTSNMIPDDVRSEMELVFLDNLRFILFGQGEIIYRLGDYAGGLYFVLEGRVSVMSDGGMPHSVPLGGFFGTAALDLHEDMGREAETLAIGYTEHVTAISGCIVVYVSREHLLVMKKVFASLSVSLRVLERKIRSANVVRTSLLEQVLTGPPASSPTLRRAMMGAKATEPLTVISKGMGFWGNQTCFDPDSKFVSMWEMWIFFATTAQCVLVIYHTCFGVYVTDDSSVFVAADTVTILLESCFLIDMYLQFRLGYYEYGNKVMDIQLIKKHYLHTSHFYVDLVALIPLFTLNWLPSTVQGRAELLNWNKLLRIVKAPTLFKSLESKYVKLTLELRLFKLVYYTFLTFHFFGCIWFDFAANSSGLHFGVESSAHANATLTTYFGANAWLPGENFVGANRSFQYFGSIFWAFGLMSASSTGELPKTVVQCFFSVCTMTSGFFLFAYVIGNFWDVIELEDSENRDFVAKLSALRQLLGHFELPQHISEKFKTYFFFKRFHSITQEHVLERVLPPSLLVDIRMFQLQPMIVKVAFLTGMEDSVTRMLISLFTQIMFVKDEYICRFGEEGSEMFFIFTGMLDILIPVSLLTGAGPSTPPASSTLSQKGASTSRSNSTEALQKVNEITAGSYFGEAALFTNAPRNAFVKAKTSCILYKLSRKSLELVFDRYPEWKKKVLRIVKIQQEQQRLAQLAAEVQQEIDGGGRRRIFKRKLSRMDLMNSRAEGIEELLLAHSRGGKKKSLTFSIQQLFLKSDILPRLHARLKPITQKVQGFLQLLANGAEIQSSFYIFWLRLATFCTVFTAVFAPYRVAYDDMDRWNGIPVLLRIVECFCEFVYWWDIWFHFRVRTNQTAMELYEQDHLLAYKRERLVWDLVAAFPIDHFVVDFVFSKQRVVLQKWLRLNRCFKVRNLAYYRNEINRRSVSFEADKVKTLWLLYLLAIFWTSCAYFAVSMHDGFGHVWQAWLPDEQLSSLDPEPGLLLLRLFAAFSRDDRIREKGKTFVPTTTLDYVFSILICFVGQLIMALMIGQMANVFILYIDNEVQYRKNHIAIEHYLARWKVSNPLKLRANAFLSSWWSSYAGVDYQAVFDDLPASVRAEGISYIAETPLLLFTERVFRPLTRGASKDETGSATVDSLMHTIAHSLRFEGYPRGEDVIVEGSVCKAMYFVVRGYLFSKSASNPSLYHASRFRMGDYFGEKGLLGQSVSLMTVSTIRASDLFVLNSQDLLEAVKSHAYFQVVFKLAQDVVRQKNPSSEFFAEESSTKKPEKGSHRRTSEPILSNRLPYNVGVVQSSSKNDDTKTARPRSSSSEAQLSKLLRVTNESEWDNAFRLFVELILPNGTLNDLDGKPRSTEYGAGQNTNAENVAATSFGGRTRRAQSVGLEPAMSTHLVPKQDATGVIASTKSDGSRLA